MPARWSVSQSVIRSRCTGPSLHTVSAGNAAALPHAARRSPCFAARASPLQSVPEGCPGRSRAGPPASPAPGASRREATGRSSGPARDRRCRASWPRRDRSPTPLRGRPRRRRDGLEPVQARLVVGIVDGLPPVVAERHAPVESFGRLHLDHERLVVVELPGSPHRHVLGRGTHVGECRGLAEDVETLGPASLLHVTPEWKLASTNSPRAASWLATPAADRAPRSVARMRTGGALDLELRRAARSPSRRRTAGPPVTRCGRTVASSSSARCRRAARGQDELERAVGCEGQLVSDDVGGALDARHAWNPR